MNYKMTKLPLFALLFILLYTSCEEPVIIDTEPEPIPSYIVDENIFGCSNGESFENIDIDFLHHLQAFNGAYFLANSDQLFVRDELGGENLQEFDMNVNNFVVHNAALTICAYEGIFVVDDNNTIEQKTTLPCHHLESVNDLLLFTTNGSFEHPAGYIYSINNSFDTIEPYTETAVDGMCSSVSRFKPGLQNSLWAANCSQEIIKFNGSQIEQYFTPDNSPIIKNDDGSQFFVLPYDDGIVVASKNGAILYQILKYTGGEWVVLKEFDNGINARDKDKFMAMPSITDGIIRDGFLYLTTNFAGCQGIQKFDISKNEELKDDDYYMIQDTALPNQCFQGFSIGTDGTVYIFGQHSISIKNC